MQPSPAPYPFLNLALKGFSSKRKKIVDADAPVQSEASCCFCHVCLSRLLQVFQFFILAERIYHCFRYILQNTNLIIIAVA